ncbi:reverse transcriptase domain-containing protein [Anaerotignum sp.]|uniref:reverse transcriptase domain-containing protein n=1 Tax=Anaerotignum sp. TaxID=2039241 RepID=UPI002A83BD75|nr:reverse transcriptase domain-containing protein [Anaerotignum sp.]MDY3596892.1 reverse transcriptase domain-containing protein [Anaerotignum sp.]
MSLQYPDIIIYYIRTKNKSRKIVTYKSNSCELCDYHKKVQDFLTERFIPSIFSKGYVQGRSIYHNAVSHLYNDYFIMLDIKDFFQNINHKQLENKLFYEINLISPNQISRKECKEIVDKCSISSIGLPLGFITSPILSNIYLKEFDNIFYGELKKMNLENIMFTRYADDITVSFKCDTKEKMAVIEADIIEKVSSILKRYGLRLNTKKTRSYNLNLSNHVRVTGINIIKCPHGKRRLTIGRSVKNKLYWEAVNCFQCGNKDNIQHIKGMQSFILSVEKNGYENCFSTNMLKQINELGFASLKDLIDSL